MFVQSKGTLFFVFCFFCVLDLTSHFKKVRRTTYCAKQRVLRGENMQIGVGALTTYFVTPEGHLHFVCYLDKDETISLWRMKVRNIGEISR